MNKLLVIGIDSLDPKLLQRHRKDLPNFDLLMERSPRIKLKSVFPPDTIPAWASVFLGVNPAAHGLLYTTDVFGSDKERIIAADMAIFRRKTFWDVASRKGARVCVLFPNLIYPPWPVNGVFICRSPAEERVENLPTWIARRKIAAFPDSAMTECGIPSHMDCVTGFLPGEEHFSKYVEKAIETTKQEASIALNVSGKESFDLVFVYFPWLDIIQHSFWRHYDEADPTHPTGTLFRNTIIEFYKLMDEIVGDLMKQHHDKVIMIVSDHGHGMRPHQVVNINEHLRRLGYLQTRGGRLPMHAESAKRRILDFAARYGLMRLLVMSTKGVSISKKIYMSSSFIDTSSSLAYLSAFVGSKSYPHGGIIINRDLLRKKGIDYEELRANIIGTLKTLNDPVSCDSLVKWAYRREDLYKGKFLDRYPDVVFELAEGYGVYWGVYSNLIGKAYEHELSSGAHKEDAVLLVANARVKQRKLEASLMDVAPTLLELMGVDAKDVDFNGESVLEWIKG